MLSRQVHTYSHGSDRERIARARQAAEALFTPAPAVSPQSVPNTATDQPPRKPRVLQVTLPTPARVEEAKATATATVSRKPAAPSSIPPAHFARIRTWVKYGMTIPQVAAIYGVEVGQIARILREA
ncbi:MAG TPA: hypothetical protein VGM07_03865 [Stellaceae bacterium]